MISKTATSSAPIAVFVGRQAIYDERLGVSAYELLYRDGLLNEATFTDGSAATGRVLLNTFVEIGIDRIAGHRPAFINVNDAFVLDGHCRALPKERVVLELLEDAVPTPELIDELKGLSEEGYRIALDDFMYTRDLEELIQLAEIIKVDVRELNRRQIGDEVRRLRDFDVQLLAEKVETHDDFEYCRDLGFELFQGYFASRPRIIEGVSVPTDRLTIMQLVAKIHEPNVQIEELESLIKRDPALCYKLLLYINSTSCGVRNQITSIRQAAALTGIRKLRTWVGLLCFGSLKGKSPELVVTANVRAKMCEILAEKTGQEDPDQYFTLGLFSFLDAFTDCAMPNILKLVPLSDQINQALLDMSGPLGWALKCVVDFENCRWEAIQAAGLDFDMVSRAYLDAIEWTMKMVDCFSKVD